MQKQAEKGEIIGKLAPPGKGSKMKLGVVSLSRWLSFSGIEKRGLVWPVWPALGENVLEAQGVNFTGLFEELILRLRNVMCLMGA